MQENIISLRNWGSKLHGKDSAVLCRNMCIGRLDQERPLILNMANIKEVTPGFAFECFGMLYLSAKRRDAKIRFENVKTAEMRAVLLSGVKAAISR